MKSAKTQAIRELGQFLWARKLFWLVPLLLVLFSFGILIVMAQSSAVAPFIYVLF